MKIFIFFSLLVVVAHGSPDCEEEQERFRNCSRRHPFNLNWEHESLETQTPLFNAWKSCVGNVECEISQKVVERNVLKFELTSFLAKNLKACLGENRMKVYSNACHTEENKPHFENPKFFDCITVQMKDSSFCDEGDVEEYKKIIPGIAKYIKMKGELRNLFLQQQK